MSVVFLMIGTGLLLMSTVVDRTSSSLPVGYRPAEIMAVYQFCIVWIFMLSLTCYRVVAPPQAANYDQSFRSFLAFC